MAACICVSCALAVRWSTTARPLAPRCGRPVARRPAPCPLASGCSRPGCRPARSARLASRALWSVVLLAESAVVSAFIGGPCSKPAVATKTSPAFLTAFAGMRAQVGLLVPGMRRMSFMQSTARPATSKNLEPTATHRLGRLWTLRKSAGEKKKKKPNMHAGTRVLQTVFPEAGFLTCTLFLRKAASSLHTKATGPAAAVAQARGGQGSEAVSEGERSCSAQQAGPSVDISTSKGRASGTARAPAHAGRQRKEAASDPQRPPTSTPITTRRQRRLLPCGTGPQEGPRVGPGCAENEPPQRR